MQSQKLKVYPHDNAADEQQQQQHGPSWMTSFLFQAGLETKTDAGEAANPYWQDLMKVIGMLCNIDKHIQFTQQCASYL